MLEEIGNNKEYFGIDLGRTGPPGPPGSPTFLGLDVSVNIA